MGRKELSLLDKVINKLAHKLQATRTDLIHYPVVIMGSHIGGVFSKFFGHYDHGHTEVFCAYGPENHNIHSLKSFHDLQMYSTVELTKECNALLETSYATSAEKKV